MDGLLIASGTVKQRGVEGLVEVISSKGSPCIIATDVSKPPAFVRAVSAKFDARLFSPEKSLSGSQKRRIGKGVFDVHVRDAYSAAVKAYRAYANRFRQIDKLPVPKERRDWLKAQVVKGFKLSDLLKKND